LKREVKKLELEANKLKKQTKVQPRQDNRSNMINKFKKERTAPKIVSQQHLMDKKVEYVRSAYLNARRPHIKNRIGYKTGDKHNSRVNTRGQEFIKFSKANIQHGRIKTSRLLTMLLMLILMLLMFLICYTIILMLLMRNKIRKIIVLHVGPHQKKWKTCVWVVKCLATNLKGHN
jgi:hypothetical protein